MELSSQDYNLLIYFLRNNLISFQKVVDWAFSNYSPDGIDPFIEKIGLALDKHEAIEIITEKYQIEGDVSPSMLIGITASKFFKGEITLQDAISNTLFRFEDGLTLNESSELYIAEDYFGWHDDANHVASELASPILKKYLKLYESAMRKFST